MSYYEIKHGLEAVAKAIEEHGKNVVKAAEVKGEYDVTVAKINKGKL